MKEIKLTNSEKVALVDDDFYEAAMEHSWYLVTNRNTDYAQCSTNGEKFYMHKLVFPLLPMIDHKNGNGLDNQRENLRETNYQLNAANQNRSKVGNSSKFRGVYLHKSRGKFMARIRVSYSWKFLGYFTDEVSAALAYNKAAIEAFGEHANVNKI